jgi:hypothetical protein
MPTEGKYTKQSSESVDTYTREVLQKDKDQRMLCHKTIIHLGKNING